MVERCTDLAGEEGVPGMCDRIKERLVSMDSTSHNYVYRMEASNVVLDGSINTLNLVDYWDEDALKA
uniref:Uncharacterized protein n=1 Tax=Salix viminalis TaxID=40686 RepID=A0A6N2LRX3_SALVM